MFSNFQRHESLLQNPIFDSLYCQEEEEDCFDENAGGALLSHNLNLPEIQDFAEIHGGRLLLSGHDLVWEDEEIRTLLHKERVEAAAVIMADSDGALRRARNEAIEWILNVVGYYGFNAMTALLAVNYYDRFIASVCFQKDKPWMSQLTAVACLSIAAKVEETHVPLLLDLQVEESKFLFEAKTIQRMELLVLSTLGWKVNPVTPMSFIDHIVRRFELITDLHWQFLSKCHSAILSVITDCRFGHYLPSVVAAATMVHVIGEIQGCDATDYQARLGDVLKVSKDKVDECHKIVTEAINDPKRKHHHHKRKHDSIPSSPSGVIDAYLSSESSVDSWAVASSSVSSSPEPFLKRSRANDQHMRLTPPSSVSGGRATHLH
ncbi:cyclin-D3-3-like [Andrographis paniculata]|uniref:cyclin-D3-3-like n=1 Tax=Andrographis paniculata TaxID=175694 RepID=UPI0021E7EB8C|nr:cyclin-D3-3-like [Andrographis paniculata]